MDDWPWKRSINPHYTIAKEESDKWLQSFKPFNEASQHAFDKCNVALLAALAYPWVSKEHLRTGCDLMNLFFVLDEYTDVEDAETVAAMIATVKEALRNPGAPRPEGEVLLGELTRQFWSRAVQVSNRSFQKQFLEAFEDYLDSVVVQAEDRDKDICRTIDSYFEVRRDNIGTRPSFVLIGQGLEIPDEVLHNPVMIELVRHITDIIILDNDIVSYNKEQASGDDKCNILTIVMQQLKTDLTGALKWAADYHKVVEESFLRGLLELPTYTPEIDCQLHDYVLGIANWPRCNDCWNFESGRYFGSKGLEIQQTRQVSLLPKKTRNPNLKTKDVDVTLVEL